MQLVGAYQLCDHTTHHEASACIICWLLVISSIKCYHKMTTINCSVFIMFLCGTCFFFFFSIPLLIKNFRESNLISSKEIRGEGGARKKLWFFSHDLACILQG